MIGKWGRFGVATAVLVFLAGGRAGAGTLGGAVVGRDGKPAAGAEVWAGLLQVSAPLEVRRAVADAGGKFSMEAPPGLWIVHARRGDEGGETGNSELPEVKEGRDPAPVTIRLRAPTKFRGRLLDSRTGRPIAGGRFAIDDARVVVADAQGQFEAPGLAMKNHEAYPLCPGFERRRILFDTSLRPVAELEIKLPTAGKAVGRVLDEAGRPIPGSRVGLDTSGTIFSGAALWERCDPDGRFTWDGKAFGRNSRLSAGAPGFVAQEHQGIVAVEGEPSPTVEFRLKRDPARPVAPAPNAPPAEARRDVIGRVVTPEGKPVADAVVIWGTYGFSTNQQTKTDADGRFVLLRAPGEAGSLTVFARGFAPEFPQVVAGEDADIKVVLDRGRTVRGRVVDDTGLPLGGISVIPHFPSPDPRFGGRAITPWELAVKTDAEGKFVVGGVPEGSPQFTILGDGLSAVRDHPLETVEGAKNEVVMTAEGAIRGRVLDSAGKPARNFRVLLGIPKGSGPGDKVGGFFAGYQGIGISFTSDDGTFVVSGLTAGHFQSVKAVAEGFGMGEVERVIAHPSNHMPPAESLTIRLGPPHALRVRAFAAGGKPVAGARVTLINGDPGPNAGGFAWGYSDASWEDMVHGQANADGRATFPALGFDKATVLVRSKGFARRRVSWREDEEELLVDLEPESVVTGDVLDDAGLPVADLTLSLFSSAGDQVATTVDPTTGHFSLSELPAGPYTLQVRQAAGNPLHVEPITLEPGKTLTRPIRVPKPDPAVPKPTP